MRFPSASSARRVTLLANGQEVSRKDVGGDVVGLHRPIEHDQILRQRIGRARADLLGRFMR